MEIKHHIDKPKGYFFIEQENIEVAKMTYVHTVPGLIIIDHTEVSPVLKGMGAGKQMVAAAVKFAREESLKIIATCPFAKSVLEKTPEFSDVLK